MAISVSPSRLVLSVNKTATLTLGNDQDTLADLVISVFRGVGADRADTDAIRIYPVSVSLSPSQERAVRVNTPSGEPRPSTEEAYSISVELWAPGSETAEVISNVLLLVSQRTSPGQRAAAAEALSVTRDDSTVTLANASSCFVVLDSLSAGESAIGLGEACLIPPEGSVSYPLPDDAAGPVTWTAWNERPAAKIRITTQQA